MFKYGTPFFQQKCQADLMYVSDLIVFYGTSKLAYIFEAESELNVILQNIFPKNTNRQNICFATESELNAIQSNYKSDPSFWSIELSPNNANLFWRFVKNLTQIEVALQVKSTSWVGIGWRPINQGSCRVLPPPQTASAMFMTNKTSPKTMASGSKRVSHTYFGN